MNNAILSLIILTIPFVSRIHVTQTVGEPYFDIFFFWKDKLLWVYSYLILFNLKKVSREVLLFFGFLFIATIQSKDLYQSLWGYMAYCEGTVTFFCYGIIFMAALDYDEKDFLVWSGVSVCFMGVLGIIQIIWGNFLRFPLFKYLSGLSGYHFTGNTFPLEMSLANSNHLGLYCALLVPIFIRQRPLWWFKLVMAFLTLGSLARGAWLAVFITLPKNLWKFAIPAGILCGMYLLKTRGFSDSERVLFWINSLPLIELLGRGPGMFIKEFPHHLVYGMWVKTQVDRPHNIYLYMAYTTGFLSLFPLGLLVWNAVKKESVYRYGIFGFLIYGFFTDSMVGVTPIFCVVLALATRASLQLPTPD